MISEQRVSAINEESIAFVFIVYFILFLFSFFYCGRCNLRHKSVSYSVHHVIFLFGQPVKLTDMSLSVIKVVRMRAR